MKHEPQPTPSAEPPTTYRALRTKRMTPRCWLSHSCLCGYRSRASALNSGSIARSTVRPAAAKVLSIVEKVSVEWVSATVRFQPES